MSALSNAERVHLDSLGTARPSWGICHLHARVLYELDGSHAHKYPRTHPYITGMQFVLQYLRENSPCSVLDIGSPLTQNVAAASMAGVEVSVVDIRPLDEAERFGLHWHTGTATALPFQDASWSIVTSLWVMGHVGDGRYGDALVAEGDLDMLREVARVLKPGGTAIIGPGLVDERAGNIFNLHRIYSWPWLREAFERTGFRVLKEMNLPVADEYFMDYGAEKIGVARRDGHYALAVLERL